MISTQTESQDEEDLQTGCDKSQLKMNETKKKELIICTNQDIKVFVALQQACHLFRMHPASCPKSAGRGSSPQASAMSQELFPSSLISYETNLTGTV